MSLAIFDLDKTLIKADSDFLWGEFLTEIGVVDSKKYQQQNQKFFDDYTIGKLDINEYLKFCLEPLANNSIANLKLWRKDFITKKIKPIISTKAIKTVKKHQENGDTLLVITATNKFVAEKIIELFGIVDFLATDDSFDGEKYTGKSQGVPCFQEGKIINLENWLKNTNHNLKNSYFYSDSFNDLPLLKLVDNPIAVNPDEKLSTFAKQNNWQIKNWM